MKPARFKIPKGCESITFEQIGNTLVTTFDVESEFKIGDVCVDENDVDPIIFIFGGYNGKYPKRYADVWGDGSGCVIFPIARSYCEEMDFRHATESEKQVIFDALAKIGKMWDAEKLEITNLKDTAHKRRWRAELGKYYWGITEDIEPIEYREDNDSFDYRNYKIGNYFQTEEIAQQACDLFLESLKEFNNNLK